MASGSAILDSDFRYTDRKGNLLRTRTELSIAQMLSFLDIKYEYDCVLTLKNGKKTVVDFKTEKGIIEVIDDEKDIIQYKTKEVQTGSIFIEDPSFAFDYAHILPLVEKCSILHGHTSSVMVE